MTPTLDVSKGNVKDLIEKVNNEMNNVISVIRNGKGSDDRFFNLEMRLKVLQQKYNSLIAYEPSADTQKSKEPNDRSPESQANQFLINLLKP